MKPTLFILAAGMGSRYGGLKQLEGIGPNGETILDFSVFDAIRAGFNRIVFVISKHFDVEFKKLVSGKYEHLVDVQYVYQDIDTLPIETATKYATEDACISFALYEKMHPELIQNENVPIPEEYQEILKVGVKNEWFIK